MNNRTGKKIPIKTNINLAMKESRKRELGPAILTAAVLTAAIALFAKFGVIDRLAAASDAEALASDAQEQLSAVVEGNADFNKVLEEYVAYSLSQGLIMGRTDLQDILDMIEEKLLPTSMVESVVSSEGILTVKLSGVTLNQISGIVRILTDDPLVAYVQMYTANTKADDREALTSASLNIYLTVEEAARIAAEAAGEGGNN